MISRRFLVADGKGTALTAPRGTQQPPCSRSPPRRIPGTRREGGGAGGPRHNGGGRSGEVPGKQGNGGTLLAEGERKQPSVRFSGLWQR